MGPSSANTNPPRFWLIFIPVFLMVAAVVAVQQFQAASSANGANATYSHGILNLALPYDSSHAGPGQLIVEVLDPEDQVVGRAERHVQVAEGKGYWREQIKVSKPLAIDELVWHRVRYRFEYADASIAKIEGTESISQILRTPVIAHPRPAVLLDAVVQAASADAIATDSKNEVHCRPWFHADRVAGATARNPRFCSRAS
jgi:hypothetical protein